MSKFTGVGKKGVGQVFTGPRFHKWNDWNKGDYVVGHVTGRSEKADKYGKFGYVVAVKESNMDNFQDGDEILLNSTTLLEMKMAHVPEGAEVKVHYAGKSTIAKGKWKGTQAHNIEVFVAGVESEEEDDSEDI